MERRVFAVTVHTAEAGHYTYMVLAVTDMEARDKAVAHHLKDRPEKVKAAEWAVGFCEISLENVIDIP